MYILSFLNIVNGQYVNRANQNNKNESIWEKTEPIHSYLHHTCLFCCCFFPCPDLNINLFECCHCFCLSRVKVEVHEKEKPLSVMDDKGRVLLRLTFSNLQTYTDILFKELCEEWCRRRCCCLCVKSNHSWMLIFVRKCKMLSFLD